MFSPSCVISFGAIESACIRADPIIEVHSAITPLMALISTATSGEGPSLSFPLVASRMPWIFCSHPHAPASAASRVHACHALWLKIASLKGCGGSGS